jgi:hypothetical protein
VSIAIKADLDVVPTGRVFPCDHAFKLHFTLRVYSASPLALGKNDRAENRRHARMLLGRLIPRWRFFSRATFAFSRTSALVLMLVWFAQRGRQIGFAMLSAIAERDDVITLPSGRRRSCGPTMASAVMRLEHARSDMRRDLAVWRLALPFRYGAA